MNVERFLFARGRKASIKRHLTLWIVGYLVLAGSYPPHGSFGAANGIEIDGVKRYYEMVMIRTFFHFLCQMIFCYPFLYFLVPRYLWTKRYAPFFGLLLLLLGLASCLRYSIFRFAYNPLMSWLHFYINTPGQILKISVIQNFDGPAFIGFTFIAFKLFKDWQRMQRDNLDLKKENANAELQLLKAQIHPHFLFNTLNNIYSFTIDRSPLAKGMVRRLEDMLHYMVEECDEPMVSLKKEISVINDYFELERVRYGNNIAMQLEFTGDCADKVVCPLLMIPFVENSFKHGASRMLRDPWIRLAIQVDDDIVHFSLTNNKPVENGAAGKKGIGLQNVRKRLELLYPARHLLVVESTANTFTVNMQIPAIRVVPPAGDSRPHADNYG